MPVKLHLHATVVYGTPVSIVDFSIDDASARLSNAYQNLAKQQLGQIVNTTFGIADATVSTGVKAQDIVDGAKALNEKQIIGGLVNVLDSVVKVGDDISAVHHDTLP